MLLTLDIGGSAIKSALIDDDMNLLEQESWDVPTSWDEMVLLISNKYHEKSKKHLIEGIAIAAPGSVSSEEGIIYGASAIPYIHGPNFKKIFKEKINQNIEIENDANCAALAEAYLGNNADKEMLSLVVLGSGVGGANLYKKEIIKGSHLHGGEFGYTVLNSESGQYQSFSTLASVGGLVRQAQAKGIEVKDGKALFALEKENAIIKELIQDFYKYLAVGLFNIQYTYDPDVLVLGGAISKRKDLLKRIEVELDKIMEIHDSATLRPTIEISKFGNDANLYGAVINYKKREGKI